MIIKKITVSSVTGQHPINVYFAPDVFKSLVPLPSESEQEAFLQHIAGAYYTTLGYHVNNNLLFTRIAKLNADPDNHEYVAPCANFGVDVTQIDSIDSKHIINIDKIRKELRFSACTTLETPDHNSDHNDLDHNDSGHREPKAPYLVSPEEFIRVKLHQALQILQPLADEIDKNAKAAFERGEVLPPTQRPKPIPAPLDAPYNAAAAVELFELKNLDPAPIEDAVLSRKNKLRTISESLEFTEKQFSELIQTTEAPTNDYDVAELIKILACELSTFSVEINNHTKSARKLIADENQRLSTIMNSTRMQILQKHFVDDEKFAKDDLLQNIKNRFRDHEAYANQLRFFKQLCVWYIQEAARLYYIAILNAAKEMTDINARKAYLLQKCESFNNRFKENAGIELHTNGQLEFSGEARIIDAPLVEDAAQENTLAKKDSIEAIIRKLLVACNQRRLAGVASSHYYLTEELKKFSSECQKVFADKKAAEESSTYKGKQTSGYGFDFTGLINAPQLFSYEDPNIYSSPMQTLMQRNFGGNVQFKWHGAVGKFATDMLYACANQKKIVAGEDGTEQHLYTELLNCVANSVTPNENIASAKSKIEEAKKKTAELSSRIAKAKLLLTIQKKLSAPCSQASQAIADIEKSAAAIESIQNECTQIAQENNENLVAIMQANVANLAAKAEKAAKDAKEVFSAMTVLRDAAVTNYVADVSGIVSNMEEQKAKIQAQKTSIGLYEKAIAATKKILSAAVNEIVNLNLQARLLAATSTAIGENNPSPAFNPTLIKKADEIIRSAKEASTKSLQIAAVLQEKLAEELKQPSESPAEIILLTQQLETHYAAIFNEKEKVATSVFAVSEMQIQVHSSHEETVKFCQAVAAIVNNINFWGTDKTHWFGGEVVENRKIPLGIKHMQEAIKQHHNYESDLRAACELKTAFLEAAREGKLRRDESFRYRFFGLQDPITTKFYSCFSGENNRLFQQIDAWSKLNLPTKTITSPRSNRR